MPTRLIREGLLTSETVCSLSKPQQIFFYRLLLIGDDYGLYDARPAVLRARMYVFELEKVSLRDVQDWHNACVQSGLVKEYEVEGRKFGQILKYGQQAKSAPKHPLPPWAVPEEYQASGKKQQDRIEPLRAVTNRHLGGAGGEVNSNKLVGRSTVCVGAEGNPLPPVETTEGFSAWLAALTPCHPSLKKSRVLADDVDKAARDAFKRCPEAMDSGPLLGAYMSSSLKKDSNGKLFYRPRGQRLFFDTLEDVIYNAELWAKETEWHKKQAPRKTVSARSGCAGAQPREEVLSEEAKRAAIGELHDMLNAPPRPHQT